LFLDSARVWEFLRTSPNGVTLRQAQGFTTYLKYMDWYIYILLCDQKSYYVGLTHNLKERLTSHKSKANIATKEFSDLKLVYNEKHCTRKEDIKERVKS